jgi:hypothetical protein
MSARPGRIRVALTSSALIAGVLPSVSASAEPESSHQVGEPIRRLHLGLRTGFGVPYGKYADVRTLASSRDEDVNALGDDTHGVIPLWFDVGYRLSQHLMLGGYFMYGFVLPKAASATDPLGGGCPEGLDCFASGLRFGIQGQYSFAPSATVNPWLGLALGYERVSSQLTGELFSIPIDASTTHAGPDLLQLQGGADFRAGHAFALGPFAAASVMQYTSCTIELAGQESSCELDDGGWHGWLVLGVRGALEL